jgi:hypothetical protein
MTMCPMDPISRRCPKNVPWLRAIYCSGKVRTWYKVMLKAAVQKPCGFEPLGVWRLACLPRMVQMLDIRCRWVEITSTC